MRIQKLEILVEVAKTGSVSTAGKNLHLSQSGVSQTITQIEEELKVKIFKRSRFGVTLTEAGSDIVKKSNEVLLKYEELVERARKSADIHSNKLRVSTIPTLITYLLKPLREYKKLHSNSNFEVEENATEHTLEIVQKNLADIGLICIYGENIKNYEDLDIDVILEGKMKVYVSCDSHFAYTKTITTNQILNQPIVLYNGDYTKYFINNFQLTFGIMNVLFSSNNISELTRIISNGFSIGFAPDFAMKNNTYLLEGKIAEVDITDYEPINVALGLIRSKKKQTSKIEEHLIKFLKTELHFHLS